MNDTIFIDDPRDMPPHVEHEPGWIKHVVCEGARFHVPYWDYNGTHCSEPRCIINKRDAKPSQRGET